MNDLTPIDNYLHGSWEALGNAAPSLVALAQLSSENWMRGLRGNVDELSLEAQAILFAARERGTIELRAVNSAFDAASRLLAVYVEMSDEHIVAFRDAHRPEVTIRFLDGFRQLCALGFIVHHIFRDFSLSTYGFEVARTIEKASVAEQLAHATEFGLHD